MVLRNKKPSHFRHNRWIVLFTILWENLRILWLYYDNIGNNSDNIVFHFSTYTIWLWYILTVYCPNLIENLTYCNNSWLTYMIIILTQQYWDNIFNMLWWYYPNMVNLHNMIMTYVNRIYCPTWICDNTWLTYMMTILQNWRNDGLFWRYMLAMLSQIVMFACALLHASFCFYHGNVFSIGDVRGGENLFQTPILQFDIGVRYILSHRKPMSLWYSQDFSFWILCRWNVFSCATSWRCFNFGVPNGTHQNKTPVGTFIYHLLFSFVKFSMSKTIITRSFTTHNIKGCMACTPSLFR